MRGDDGRDEGLFSYIRLEERVPADHPLRAVRTLADEVLAGLSERFEGLYARTGRPSIAPEMLLRATLLQAFFSVRSERLLMEQIDYNLLFRWFVGLEMDARVWHPTVFTHNRERLMAGDVAQAFLAGLMALPQVRRLLSSEHFSVDGTLIDAWASMKSFQPKEDGADPPEGPIGRNVERDFRGEKRSNATHASQTDPDARLYKKADGRESRLCYMGHVLMENRHGLAVDSTLTHATGTAEREATLEMIDRRSSKRRITLGADKAYDVSPFIGALRARNVTPAYCDQRHGEQTGQGAQDRHRSAHHPPSRLRHQPAYPQTHRGSVRMGQELCRVRQGQAQRQTKGSNALHHGNLRLQPHPDTENPGSASMKPPRNQPTRPKTPAGTAHRDSQDR